MTCSLGLDTLKNPLTFAHRHSFCCDCLGRMARAKEQKIVTACPRCNTNIEKPDSDYVAVGEEFVGSTFINRLLKLLPIVENFEKTYGCDNCEQEREVSSCCFDCETFMCFDCHNAHKRLKILRNHRVKTFSPVKLVNGRICCQDFSLCQQQLAQLEGQEKFCLKCRELNGYILCPSTKYCRTAYKQTILHVALNEKLASAVPLKEEEKEKNEQSQKKFQDGIQHIQGYVESKTQELVQEISKLKDELTLRLSEFQDKHICNYSQSQNSFEHRAIQTQDQQQGKNIRFRRCESAETLSAAVTIISSKPEQKNLARGKSPSFLKNEVVVAVDDVNTTDTDGPCVNGEVFDGENMGYNVIKEFCSEGEGKGKFRVSSRQF